ncbi:hypothetical protein [Pinibacter soli]|uniref:Uncharacterized protein n=1 Tax=Pinibacter soli TaxID=3044211 RepID=A0ABT6RH59_9BACT|nr:hypothetical protein [Pinibacter soli]MDI3321904.1 hypothetical protein [Pinibacter soli]
MLIKEEVLRIIEQLPEKFTIDQLVNKIVFLEKVKKGLQQSLNGETISAEQAKQLLTSIN